MILDRELQGKILQIAAAVYPQSVQNELDELCRDVDEKKLASNLKYLEQHHLLEPESIIISLDGIYSLGVVRITNRGLDFLEDDGGLSAILNVVTIKFETEQIKAILTEKINNSSLPPEEKNNMSEALKQLPAETLKHLTMKIVDKGWDSADSLVRILQNTF